MTLRDAVAWYALMAGVVSLALLLYLEGNLGPATVALAFVPANAFAFWVARTWADPRAMTRIWWAAVPCIAVALAAASALALIGEALDTVVETLGSAVYVALVVWIRCSRRDALSALVRHVGAASAPPASQRPAAG